MNRTTDIYTFTYPFFRSVGQVMFQRSLFTGILITLALFLAASGIGGRGHIAVFIGIVVITAAVTAVARCFRYPGYADGLAGFNAVLVAAALFTFFIAGPGTWILSMTGALLTLPLKRLLDRLFAPVVSSLTLPFVLAAWIAVAVGNISGITIPYTSEDIASVPDLAPITLLMGLLKGVSQVFLSDSWVAGVIILIALAVSSRKAAIWTLVGSASGMLLALVCGLPAAEIASGLWGFSPALTALAVTTVLPPRRHRLLCLVTALLSTFAIQMIATPLLALIHLPVLTFPFCVATIACAYLFPAES